MKNRRLLVLAAVLGAAAVTPAASAAPNADTVKPAPAKVAERAAAADQAPHRRVRRVTYILRGVLVADAHRRSAEVEILGTSRHLARALAASDEGSQRARQSQLAETLRVRIGRGTIIISRGRARRARHRALREGDRVIVAWRAPIGIDAERLPAARRIVDRGPVPQSETPPPELEPEPDPQPEAPPEEESSF